MHQSYDRTAVPVLISLGINRDLIAKAKKLNLDLAKELEMLIIQKIEQDEQAEWTASNSTTPVGICISIPVASSRRF